MRLAPWGGGPVGGRRRLGREVAFVYALRTRVPRLRVTALVMALFPWIIASAASRMVVGVELLLGRS